MLKHTVPTPLEQRREADLFELLPRGRSSILEIGPRDGHHTRRLTEIFDTVTALDLEKPAFEIPGVTGVKGNVLHLDFTDFSFDCVLCAEVLEHVPDVERAVSEIERVTRHEVLIGVPYKQDIRVGRLTCNSCGKINPPYGHVNTFDEYSLERLFTRFAPVEIRFVGSNRDGTNAFSTFLMDFAGNPWGTYGQGELCIHCRSIIEAPVRRSAPQRLASLVAYLLNRLQQPFIPIRGNWIHLLLRRSV